MTRWFSWFGGGQSTEKNVKEKNMKAFIQPVGTKTGLFSSDGSLIGTYSRARDAKRGAERNGLTLISA